MRIGVYDSGVGGLTVLDALRRRMPHCDFVYTGDTAPSEIVQALAADADVLVHEATFTEAEADRALQTGHSTARQAAEIARDAEVRLLALTHVSTRYGGGEIREEARGVFEHTEVPRDFDAIEVPFAEKDEPALVRWDP